MRRSVLALLIAVSATPALAETPVVVSETPEKLAVTIYRGSLALITETRTIILPPGEATVRFEGVASGIVPQSAILFDPEMIERNRDAALLSQSGLVDAFTGQRVTLRRTDPATGKTEEETATVRSAADRLVVTTPRGVEAIYCSGLNQTLIYPQAPVSLSAKPVLSMRTKAQSGGKVTVTLAYLATGFDWSATYVADLSRDGKSIALLGWMTMTSEDDTSFPDATAAAVGGQINRSGDTNDDAGQSIIAAAKRVPNKTWSCWPSKTTSDIDGLVQVNVAVTPAPIMMEMNDIVVTAQRREERLQDVPSAMRAAVVAKAENLGDLKLYRIPVPVTVAARSQKQVAFMLKERVSGELLYRTAISGTEAGDPEMLFRFRNRKQDGLGDPLPQGNAIVFQQGAHGRAYLGEAQTGDKTIDEEVELAFGEAANITIENTEKTGPSGKPAERIVTIRNANPFPVRFEADFLGDPENFSGISGKVLQKPGKRTWRAMIPANDSSRLTFHHRND
jgi:hypothetical protein